MLRRMEAAPQIRVLPSAGVILAALLLGACAHTSARPAPDSAATPVTVVTPTPKSHWYWPFGRHVAPAPQPVEELVVEAAPGSASNVLQFWERNTLVIDLRSVSGSGSVTLTRRPRTTWPVRLSFRVVPGSIGQLEVKATQRAVFVVAAASSGKSGGAALDLALGPGVYTPRTPAITLEWGPAPAVTSPP